MMHPLLSDGHIAAARKLFPSKACDPDWLQRQWTDEEVSACKIYEFINAVGSEPTLRDWEAAVVNGVPISEYTDEVLEWYVSRLRDPHQTVLSIGPGLGHREIALLFGGHCRAIDAVDITPYQGHLNRMLPDDVSRRLRSVHGNVLSLPYAGNAFEVILCHAVVSCIPDALLMPCFKEMLRVLKPGGLCMVSCSANLSPYIKTKIWAGKYNYPPGWKQIGWLRDRRHIVRRFPSGTKLLGIQHLQHDLPVFLKRRHRFIGHAIQQLSRRVYPLINQVNAFEITK